MTFMEGLKLDNRQWGQKLRAAYKEKTKKPSGIRLPAANEILFDGEVERVTITMSERAVVANVQTDAAAFEAWSLALKVWCGVKAVELKWDRPRVSPNDWCHYQRFLFRAERFGLLCGDWFRVAEAALLSDAEASGTGPFFLNVPGDRSPFDAPISTGGRVDGGRESDVEKLLLKSPSFRRHFGLRKVDRQLPVGLFREQVAKEKRIFTGGKSAIDLIGIGSGALRLFELKAEDNAPAGILSEFFFYASVVRDAIPAPARFRFDPSKLSVGQGVSPGDLLRCTSIEAVVLAEEFHPLIEDGEIVGHLNKAATVRWNKEPGHVPVSFRAVLLKRSTNQVGEFAFEDIAA